MIKPAGKVHFIFSSIRARLSLLILIALLPAAGLAIINALEQRRVRIETAKTQLLSLVEAAGGDLLERILDNQLLLRTLAEVPNVRTANLATCGELLSSLVNSQRWYPLFLVVNDEGRGLCGSEAGHSQNHYNDRDYFKAAIKTSTAVVGRPVLGRVTRKPVLPIAHPVIHEARVTAVLVSALDLLWYGETIARQTPFLGTIVTLWDDQGQILYRYPDNNVWAGKDASQSALAAEIRKAHGARALQTVNLEGKQTVYAITDLPGHKSLGLKVAIGVPENELLKLANEQLIRTLSLLILVFLLAMAAANVFASRVLARPIDRLVAAARRLESGNLREKIPEPIPVGELGILAAALNDSMSSLQAEREKVLGLNKDLEARVAERTAQLEEANRELEAFSYSVSHDLRAPLRHIQGFCELLPKSFDNQFPAKAERYLKTISSSAERMGNLIDDLLSFSRMQRTEMRECRVELPTLVNEVITSMRPGFKERHIDWTVAALPNVQGDPRLLSQVFVNLIDNAVKYTRPRDPAKIEIGCIGEADGWHTLFVRDNGVGFDMKYSHKLFGVFQRLHGESEFEGTGVGLANVQRIVARHGGRVWAEAEPDKGATLYFTLKAVA